LPFPGSPTPVRRVPLTQAILGLRPSGRLRRSKFDPVKFVFTCPKTILSGTNGRTLMRPIRGRARDGAAQRNRKKGHPGLCAPHVYPTCGVPSLGACLRRSAQGPFFAAAVPAPLERPVRTVRGAPARRGGDSLDPRLLPACPWPWPGRAVSFPRPFGRVLRLRASLGLSKGG
jgi:hypothetical protein